MIEYYLHFPITPEQLAVEEIKENPKSTKFYTKAMMEECTLIANTVYNWGRKGQLDLVEKGEAAAKEYMYLFHGKKAKVLVEKWIEIASDTGDFDGFLTFDD